jgi:hypothetical protein
VKGTTKDTKHTKALRADRSPMAVETYSARKRALAPLVLVVKWTLAWSRLAPG